MGSTTNAPSPKHHDDSPTVEQRRALVERIAASEHFRRSARLRDFLLYVGRQSLIDGCPEINEQEIGTKVFGRSPSYIRSQDNIVRVNATELRKRIDQYFATEGVHETLVIEIPRGGYKPVFHWRQPTAEPMPHHPGQAVALDGPRTADKPVIGAKLPRKRIWFLWETLSAALAIACVALLFENHGLQKQLYTWEGKPAVTAFWADFLRSHQQTDIVLADASLTLIEDLINRPIPLSDYMHNGYMGQVQALDLSPDRRTDLNQIFDRNLVAFGDFRAAQQILALSPVSSSLRLELSRYYTADSLKHDNVILVGGAKANPWIHLFDGQMNFNLDYNTAHEGFVENRKPRPGEQSLYTIPSDPNTLTGYSVIAYLPNPSRTGNAIILAGTDSDATNAAAEFLTSETDLEKFQNTLHVHKFPYFEVLLKTSRLSGTALNAEMIAYRTYPTLN